LEPYYFAGHKEVKKHHQAALGDDGEINPPLILFSKNQDPLLLQTNAGSETGNQA